MPTPSQQPTTGSKLGVLPTIILGIGAFIGLIFLVAAFSGGIGNFIGCILMGVGAFAVFFILAMMLRDRLRGNQQLSASGAMKVFLVPVLLFIVGWVIVPGAQSKSDSATTTSTVTTQVSTTVLSTTSRTQTASSSSATSTTETAPTTEEPVEKVQHGLLYQEPSSEPPAPAPAPEVVKPAAVEPAQPPAQQPAQPPAQQPASVHYRNCQEAKNAGAAPIYRGEPGYAPHLDRDGDGIACEK
ncbi:excalibur calcium-binding domain-containing protein [Corynebacterium spheniscorum]|uniref:Excalibur calcium-binding domain-containing protein n=1 Tax=Corynebacterium spheniscorum TaxID=185761 RepID=A0A1I2UJP1_9CORY|nr:excalibur calcium-binding domain-containing protein [Corynebacterium spheniscorum]KAA8720183.1 excalibur calcium-binding domain-containing protein [Corynebacterium spheniscorum]SFG77384.1 Excalibur calcium-binding domain-containing protein [Corynebacterium spheniscorum]